MNSYNIYREDGYGTTIYHAIAESVERVRELAAESGIDIDGMVIEETRRNVRDEHGIELTVEFKDALIR